MLRFDAHCHVFNGRILADATRMMAKPEVVKASWFSWIVETVLSMIQSEGRNNQFVCKSIKDRFPKDTPATIPLAMDIQYLFTSPLKYGEMSGVENKSLFINSGLQKQIDALKRLSARGNCFPFFPVDPRRPGVVKAVLDGKIVTRKKGGFYGVKLYPRLGYHPQSGNMRDLYAYCEANGIPITSHAGAGGFPPFGTNSGEFSNPENFRPILMKFPNLKIDFAHWGIGNDAWSESILSLMHDFPNVYSDLACYSSPGDLPKFIRKYGHNPLVIRRTLYGSDFDVFYLTETKFDMNSYLDSFINQMGEDDLDSLMCVNPVKFLDIEQR